MSILTEQAETLCTHLVLEAVCPAHLH